jgi:4-hydroxybutyrate dehydrogenase/sulfolactaldehyde 3-reductase
MERIGFVGLGRMGRPMAANLARKGFDLTVYDINPAAMRALKNVGARAANGVPGLAQSSDIIVSILPNGAEVEAVTAGPDGIFAHARPGQLVMDMSTIEPQVIDRLAAEAARRGLAFVDAPVGRLASHADRGESLFMVGGTEADFNRVLPLLQAMGTTIHHCGPVGSGMRTKLVNNLLAIASCQLNAEALALSQRFNLDLAKTLEVIHGTTATNGQLKLNWPDKVLAGDTTPGFTIDLAHKDLSLIIAAAQAETMALPMVSAARQAFTMARAAGHGANDFSSIVDWFCAVSDADKPKPSSRCLISDT